MILRDCPFCTREDPSIKISHEHNGEISYSVCCPRCQCSGPRSFMSGTKAEELWNIRVSDLKEKETKL